MAKVIKRTKNAVWYDDGTVKVLRVRLSFPHLDKPYAKDDGDGKNKTPKYSLRALMDKETHPDAKGILVEMIQKIMKEKDIKVGKANWFIKDGDDSERDEDQGMWTFNASESRKVKLFYADGSELDLDDKDEIRELFYAGCYVDVIIRPWLQNNDFGKKVNAGLLSVRFRRDGEAFGEGAIDTSDRWDDEEDWDDDEEKTTKPKGGKASSEDFDDYEDL